MLAALADPILPIFAVLVAGFLMQKAALFDAGHAAAINRFVFYLGAPALVTTIIATAPLEQIAHPALLAYLGAEIATYAGVAAIARLGFGRPPAEALLIGMAASFSNHVFFVRPIAVLVYGEDQVFPMAGVILLDALVFTVTVFLVDMIRREGSGGALAALIRNPFVYAPPLGAALWFLGDLAPAGILTFTGFAGGAAAPVSLFALGIVLAGQNITRLGPMLWITVGAKLAIHPVLVWALLSLGDVEGVWRTIPVLTAAAPCGAMPFVIATQYGVSSETIAKAVLVSTALSVLTLSVLVT